MKKIFTLYLLIFFAFTIQAQQIKIRDSVVQSDNGGPFTARGVDYYAYNDSCKLSSITYNGGNARELINYYSNNNVSQEVYQLLDTASKNFINSYRELYYYNNFGKPVNSIQQNWDTTSQGYINVFQDSEVYDVNDYLVKELQYNWDSSTSTWQPSTVRTIYNYNDGTTDSLIIINYRGSLINDIQHIKYTYIYQNSSKVPYQTLTYTYDSSNVLFYIDRLTDFHDSVNYIVSDSLIDESKSPSSSTFSLQFTNVLTSFYDSSGFVKEYDNGFYFFGIYELDKTYHIYGSCSSALPLDLLQFSAKQQGSNINLNWKTAQEVNTNYFTIERSSDGIHFTNIGKTKAFDNNAVTKNYTYVDTSAMALQQKKLYYRLQEVDRDGKFVYSNIVLIDLNTTATKFILYPNPVKDYLNIVSTDNIANAQVSVTDLSGRILYSAKKSFTANQQMRIMASQFTKQVLIITIKTSNSDQQFKVVKE